MRIPRFVKYFSSLDVSSHKTIFNRSEHMKQLHAQGRYLGTSKIGLWNSSEEKKQKMALLGSKNALDKNSRGYGSEYAMRVNNRILLGNKFQGESGYLYFVKYPRSIKIGFSKNWERRIEYQLVHQFKILGGKVIAIISGPTNELADLEFDTFIKYQNYTKLSEDGTRYTEFLDIKARKEVYKFLEDRVKKSNNLKFIVQNKMNL